MVYITTLVVILICFFIFYQTYHIWSLNQARRKGKVKESDSATMFDVRELLQAGEREAAIDLYARMFHISRKKALQDVEELERSMK